MSDLKGPLSWYDANATCQSLGMKLLTIDSPEEKDAVVALGNARLVLFLSGGTAGISGGANLYLIGRNGRR